MKLLVCILVLALASPCIAKDKRSFWQKMFTTPKKSKTVKKHRTAQRKKVKPRSTPAGPARNGKGFYVVDQQWYANYLVHEASWNYYLEDDDGITFKDGKYHVPPVVYHHFEDLVNASKPKR